MNIVPQPEAARDRAAPCCNCGEADRRMLEGPRSRTRELFSTVFRSARTRENDSSCHLARQMGAWIVRLGFTVMMVGGPGIMEAANRGAKDAADRSPFPFPPAQIDQIILSHAHIDHTLTCRAGAKKALRGRFPTYLERITLCPSDDCKARAAERTTYAPR